MINDLMRKEYERWCSKVNEDQDLIKELKEMKGDDNKIEDAFYRNLEFGTGGLTLLFCLQRSDGYYRSYVFRNATP